MSSTSVIVTNTVMQVLALLHSANIKATFVLVWGEPK